MFFKKKRSNASPSESASPSKVKAKGKKFSGREPRRVGECPWDPGQIPGGKIPHDKKPSVVRAKAAAQPE